MLMAPARRARMNPVDLPVPIPRRCRFRDRHGPTRADRVVGARTKLLRPGRLRRAKDSLDRESERAADRNFECARLIVGMEVPQHVDPGGREVQGRAPAALLLIAYACRLEDRGMLLRPLLDKRRLTRE